MDKTSLLAIISLGGLAIHFMAKKARAAEEIPEDFVFIPEGMVVPPEEKLETIEVPIQSTSPTIPVRAKIAVDALKLLRPVLEPIPKPIPKPEVVTKPWVQEPIPGTELWPGGPLVQLPYKQLPEPVPVPPIAPGIPILIAKPIIEVPEIIKPIVLEPEPVEVLPAFLPPPEVPKPIPVISPIDIVLVSPTRLILNKLETFKNDASLWKDEFDLVMYDGAQLMKGASLNKQTIRPEWIERIKDLYISSILATVAPALHQSFENMFNSLAPLPIPAIDALKRMDPQVYQDILTNIVIGITKNIDTIYKNSIKRHPVLSMRFEGEIRKVFEQKMKQKRDAIVAAQVVVPEKVIIITPELIDAHGELITVPSLSGLYVLKREFIQRNPLVLYATGCPEHYTKVDLRKFSTWAVPDLSAYTIPELQESILYLNNLLKAQKDQFDLAVRERRARFARFRTRFTVEEAINKNFFNTFLRQAYIDAGSMVTDNYKFDKAMNNFHTLLRQGKSIVDAINLTYKPASLESATLLAYFKRVGTKIHMKYLALEEQFVNILNVIISGDTYIALIARKQQFYLPLEEYIPKKEVAVTGDDIILPKSGASIFYEFEADKSIVEKRVGGKLLRFWATSKDYPNVYMYYRFPDNSLLEFNFAEALSMFVPKDKKASGMDLIQLYMRVILKNFNSATAYIASLPTWFMVYQFGRSVVALSASKLFYDLRQAKEDVTKYSLR